MSGKGLVSLVAGFLVAGAVLMAAVFILGRGEAAVSQPADQTKVLSADSLKEVKSQTIGLENLGNLPLVVPASDLGRSNPFESY